MDRLGVGDWVTGVAGLALLVDLLAVPWYSLNSTFAATSAEFGAPRNATGFQAHAILGPLAILCALLALAVWFLQATQPGPALGLCTAAVCVTLALILALGLLVRVVFDPPNVLVHAAPGVNTNQTDVGAVLGLGLAWLLLIAALRTLRRDGISAADRPRIETLTLKQRSGSRTRAV